MSQHRQTWRRRLALAHRMADCLLAGQRIFLIATARGLALYDPLPPLGRCVRDTRGQILYRLIGGSED